MERRGAVPVAFHKPQRKMGFRAVVVIARIAGLGVLCLLGGLAMPALILFGFVLVSDGLYLLTALACLTGVILYFVLDWAWDILIRDLTAIWKGNKPGDPARSGGEMAP